MLKATGSRAVRAALLGLAVLAAPGLMPAAAGVAASPLSREYVAAEQAFRGGDLDRAEHLYTKILESHGDEPMAWFRIGLIQQRRRSFRAALSAYDSALTCAATGPGSASLAGLLAKVRFNRALLLLDSASRDLNSISRQTLDPSLDVVRETVTAHVDAALRSADIDAAIDAPKAELANHTAAESYVYEARPAGRTAGTETKSTEEEHR